MTITDEQSRALFNLALDEAKKKLNQAAIPWDHKERNILLTLQPLEFTDNKTAQTFYALVHVFVSEEKEDVTKLVAGLGQLELPR